MASVLCWSWMCAPLLVFGLVEPSWALTPLLFPCMILQGPSPSPILSSTWERAGAELGPGGVTWETTPAQHLPNPEKLLPHDRARQPCCWGGLWEVCEEMANQSRCLGCGNPAQLGARVWTRLFLPLPAPSGSFPSPNKVFVKMLGMAELSSGWGCAGGPATVTVPGVTAFAEGGVPLSVTIPTWVQGQLELPALLPVGWGKVTQPPPGTLEVRIVLVCAIHLHGDLNVAFQYLNGL